MRRRHPRRECDCDLSPIESRHALVVNRPQFLDATLEFLNLVLGLVLLPLLVGERSLLIEEPVVLSIRSFLCHEVAMSLP